MSHEVTSEDLACFKGGQQVSWVNNLSQLVLAWIRDIFIEKLHLRYHYLSDFVCGNRSILAKVQIYGSPAGQHDF